jgi:hypothetical protein
VLPSCLLESQRRGCFLSTVALQPPSQRLLAGTDESRWRGSDREVCVHVYVCVMRLCGHVCAWVCAVTQVWQAASPGRGGVGADLSGSPSMAGSRLSTALQGLRLQDPAGPRGLEPELLC